MKATKSHKGLYFQLLYDQATIQAMVGKLAGQINQYYRQIIEK